jgi:hypothetical protein
MVVLFSSGFPLTSESESELTATIDACNKANVAIYALDVRGLVTGLPRGSSKLQMPDSGRREIAGRHATQTGFGEGRVVLASFPSALLEPQRPGGGGGGGGRPGGGEARRHRRHRRRNRRNGWYRWQRRHWRNGRHRGTGGTGGRGARADRRYRRQGRNRWNGWRNYWARRGRRTQPEYEQSKFDLYAAENHRSPIPLSASTNQQILAALAEEPVDSQSSTPTICCRGLRRSGGSKTNFTSWATCRKSR